MGRVQGAQFNETVDLPDEYKRVQSTTGETLVQGFYGKLYREFENNKLVPARPLTSLAQREKGYLK